MSRSYLNPPLVARNGRQLRVVVVARISTDKQDEKSLADQEALVREWLTDHYAGRFGVKVLATQGSGERLDRKELRRLKKFIKSRKIDLVISEDLGRIARRLQASEFCELCEDHGVRLIALNDNIDTAQEDWRMNSFFASFRHEQYNRDTAKRIRRSLRNRFNNGGVVQTVIFCYEKSKECEKDEQLKKRPEMEPVIEEIFRRLEDDQSYSEVADWLNAQGVPTGQWCRRKTWTGVMVRRIVFNPILKGVRVRNRRISKRVNKTGRRKSVKAPEAELQTRLCPHLAFVAAERYDRLIRKLELKNAMYSVGKMGKADPRLGRPKKRTVWPGQHVTCGVCGYPYVYGGHGKKQNLMCNGAREYACWNGATFNGPEASAKIAAAVLDAISSLPGYDATYEAEVRAELERKSSTKQVRHAEFSAKLAGTERKLGNIIDAVSESGGNSGLYDRLRQLEAEKSDWQDKLRDLEKEPSEAVSLPSMEELKQLAKQAFQSLAHDSPDFARLMKKLITTIVVDPFRPIDGGDVVLRARFTLTLLPLVPELKCLASESQLFRSQEIVVDLFEPPQRIAYRERVVTLIGRKMFQRDVGKELGITQPAVQNALKLDALMQKMATLDPYVLVTEPPDDNNRFRRHKHPRYHFSPKPPLND
ncbi:recombinase family protein [Anatilimnocola floriformis]|uniref:recombinase family protein n=1 Tax=Anatilimnocola floriformis TaxID=2948575 RepID=UPI0020C2310B|nr:recombinase family protein [Anatilimnocola floriformis]